MEQVNYGEAIRFGFEYLLEKYSDFTVFGQGLWSPWYVGNTMTNLDEKFGRDRVIDSPVSELACTGAAVGASICGIRTLIVHPRMDFMVLAIDQIVSQAAKWNYMFGGQSHAPVTFRGIINRGGEQGAQHSQALHSWYAHIPGLRVVMPSTVSDARDLLIASVLCPDPVMYIDDRWLYERTDTLSDIQEINLSTQGPVVRSPGTDITIVGSGYSSYLCEQAKYELLNNGVNAEIIDLRVINPIDADIIIDSVKKTKNLLVVDGGWSNCGLAGEIIASVTERLSPSELESSPRRMTLPNAPAPTSRVLESAYYMDHHDIVRYVLSSVADHVV